MSSESPSLNKPKHLKYWTRCLKTYLPHAYIANDSMRMTLAFFIVSALDLLDCLKSHTTEAERKDYVDWIYHCQHPHGGFRGFPATDFGELRNETNAPWDPANLPATYFALATLIILGDDLQRVRRRACLKWLAEMQRPDGSFGETLGENGVIEGGMDTRFGYCAGGVRYILRGLVDGPVEGVKDIEVDKLVWCIRGSETYDGGISEAPFHEAHAGFTYCAIGCLSFLDRLPHGAKAKRQDAPENNIPITGLSNLDITIRWLVSRQTMTLDEEDAVDTRMDETDTAATCHDAHSFVKMGSFISTAGELSYKDRPSTPTQLQWAGFNGRCNKIADTCYAFWAGGSLGILNKVHLIDHTANRRYLLEKTQHMVGGFGKQPADPPDVYHSYLGLAALALVDEPGVKPISPTLCVSKDALRHLEGLPWRRKVEAGDAASAQARGTDTLAVREGAVEGKYAAMSGG
ncbi:hypothetical protein W97_04290 [Coniosporium apollinis CBS 100218]|uniref:Prenyltransferase alpha-alpha toroid domain-containing protein n=1 Tax=Coniosporium apollinis (strain CBS 100218) TaxID=1168221 RepID=R7YT42_CONA1|nr:uncharacterized protein W97_04290 [Coniosporium apollinis CBS 100218]EON65055.1 hypothetical protein W97_04290 [Coniosporium apollinis CBS 100218]